MNSIVESLQLQTASSSRTKCSIVRDEGVQTHPDKIAVLKDWPSALNIEQLRSFLGFAGYYRRLVCNYSKIVKQLNSLLVGHPTNKRKGKKSKCATPWSCEFEQQLAFNTIIEKLTSPPVLAYADYSKPFMLKLAASGADVDAILHQEQDV